MKMAQIFMLLFDMCLTCKPTKGWSACKTNREMQPGKGGMQNFPAKQLAESLSKTKSLFYIILFTSFFAASEIEFYASSASSLAF